jgi:hypothetical protein
MIAVRPEKSLSENLLNQIAQENWFSRGKQDALLGYSKNPPETDPEQASQYDLGYSEGSIQYSPIQSSSDGAIAPEQSPQAE